MKKLILASTLAASAAFGVLTSSAYSAVPCEDMLVTLNNTIKTAKLNDADTKAVAGLKAKAEERCTAEDDKRSDGFVADAMKIMGK